MSLVLQAEVSPLYLAGFPMPAALILENQDPHGAYFGLPFIERFGAPGPFALRIESGDTAARVVDADWLESGSLRLPPRGRARFLVDLAQWCTWTPGRHDVYAEYVAHVVGAASPPVVVRVAAPTPEDARIAIALRCRFACPPGDWNDFVLGTWAVPAAEGLSPEARRAVALHLFMHYAIYGPDPVGALAMHRLHGIEGGPLDAEVAALRYEIAAASGQPRLADQRRGIETRWPDLTWRLDEADRGVGFLQSLRATYGIEASEPRPRSPYLP
jgi:hypothetical protein